MSSPDFRLIALPYEDTDQRCAACGKRKVVDIGFSVFGEHEGHAWCLNCDTHMPETGWALFQLERSHLPIEENVA